ncbi:hypothetical protein [Labilibacter marinus]|uniref:hypothetical protein n=1 Tax=Labilibacter marinus TaxID=1477105 RepID=UPI00117AACEC|nr:hypothetical protein [Labilibacter marinus]
MLTRLLHLTTRFSLLLCINFCLINILQAQQFNHYIPEGIHPYEKSKENIQKELHTSYQLAIKSKDTSQIIQSRLLQSTMSRVYLDYGSAFNHVGEALFLAEDYKDTLLMAKAHEEFGVLNYLFRQDGQAFQHFSKSLKYYKKAYQKQHILSKELYRPYYNMILYHQRIQTDEMTLAYIDTCESLADTSGLNENIDIFLNEKKAHLLYRADKYEDASKFLIESIDFIEKLRGSQANIAKYKSYLIILYTMLANCYIEMNKNETAKAYYQKAIDLKDLYGEHTFYRPYIYTKYAWVLNTEGNYKKAYALLFTANRINDNYLNPRNKNNQNFISIKDKYSEELSKKNKELQLKNLELAQNKQEILRFRIILFVSILTFVIVLLVFRSRTQHLKHQKENELNEKKQQETQEVIDHKNKELTTTMLQLIEKEEIIKSLSERLSKDPSNKSLLSSIEKRSVSLWDAFNSRFVALNADFYERLKKRVPDLSSADLKICALIKLNFSGKEMAYLLGISAGSVNVARHRLRKKMNIERDTNLTQFINSI